MLYDPAIPLLRIYWDKTLIQKDTCTSMFIAALFTIAGIWKQPRCLSTAEWITKMWKIPCSIPGPLFFSRGDLIHFPCFSVIYSILYLQPTPLPWANISCKKAGSKYFIGLWPTYSFSRIYSLSYTCSWWTVVNEQAGLCTRKILFTKPGGCPMAYGLPKPALDQISNCLLGNCNRGLSKQAHLILRWVPSQ